MELIQSKDMLCPEAAIASVAHAKHINYEMIFSECWRFDLTMGESNNIEALAKKYWNIDCNVFKLASRYHNINVRKVPYKEDAVQRIWDEVRSGKTVLLPFQLKERTWEYEYEYKFDKFGMILLYAYDEEKQGFYCLDIHNSKRNEFLPNDNLERGVKGIWGYDVIDGSNAKNLPFDWRELFVETLTKLVSQSASKAKEEFFKIYETIIQYTNAPKEEPFINSKFNYIIKTICRNRNLYPMCLHYIGRINNRADIIALSRDFQKIGSKWTYLYSKLSKTYMRSEILEQKVDQKKNEYVLDILNEIWDEEYNAYKQMQKISECEVEITESNEDREEINCNCNTIAVNLNGYINDKIFYTKKEMENAHFEKEIRKIIFKDEVISHGLIETKGISYSISLDKEFDNVVCNGQEIEIGNLSAKYKVIAVACMSVWGTYYGDLCLIYSDGSNEKIRIKFEDLNHLTPEHVEERIWNGVSYSTDYERKEEAFIYGGIYRVDETKTLVKINLPKLQDSHVLAITLGY